MIVFDDRLLFEVLSGTETAEFAQHASGGIATTFSWYYRLSRALATERVDGSLIRQFAALTYERRTHVNSLLAKTFRPGSNCCTRVTWCHR